MASENYLGNPRLKRADTKVEYTPEQVAEYIKCSEDPIYFILTYCKIVNIDKGLIIFPLWEFQKEMILAFEANRFVICKMPRQVGKTTTVAAYLLWKIVFNEEYSIAILANKDRQAREILGRIQLMFEHLPKWLQMGVTEWNKGNIKLENGSEILASTERERALGQNLGDIQARGMQSAYENAQAQFERDRSAGFNVGQQNLQAAQQRQQLGTQTGLQAALANQSSNLDAQRLAEQSRQFGSQQGLAGMGQMLEAGRTLGNLGLTQQQADTQRLGLQAASADQYQQQRQQPRDHVLREAHIRIHEQ